MPTGQIDPRYGDASATAPPWDDIERLLTDAQLYWIITVRADVRTQRGKEFVEASASGGGTSEGAWVYRVSTAKVLAFGGTHGQTAYRF